MRFRIMLRNDSKLSRILPNKKHTSTIDNEENFLVKEKTGKGQGRPFNTESIVDWVDVEKFTPACALRWFW